MAKPARAASATPTTAETSGGSQVLAWIRPVLTPDGSGASTVSVRHHGADT